MKINFIKREAEAFNVFNADAKRLIAINLVYALAFPFIIIFGSAFVLRITNGNNSMTIIYNWGFFIGLIAGYFINGKLLKNSLDVRKIFAFGMLLTVIPLSILMYVAKDIGYYVIIYGLCVGTGNGIYWSCRNIITYQTTNDQNRNFFASLEQFIIIFCNALIPLLFGTLILGKDAPIDFKMQAYKYTSFVVVGITLFAAHLILKSSFKTPAIKKFVFWKLGKIWNVQRFLTFTVGMVEAGFMVLMTLLILNVAGDESVLGKIEFSTAIISVISIYIVGRIAKPQHRGKIMLAGAISLILGSTVLAFTIENQNIVFDIFAISFIGVVAMKVGQVIADPMVHSSFRATFLTSIEKASKEENRDSYAFIMDNEYFMNGGRIFGGLLFIFLKVFFGNTGSVSSLKGLLESINTSGGSGDLGALKYTFIILALIQLISAFLVNKLAHTRISAVKNQHGFKKTPSTNIEIDTPIPN